MDLKSPLNINIMLLRIVGLWPQNGQYEFNLYAVHAFCCVIIFNAIHNLFQIIHVYFIHNNLQLIFSSSLVMLPITVITVIKSCFFMKNLPVIRVLWQTLNDDVFQPRTKKQEDILKGQLGVWRRIYMFFFIMANITVVMWWLFPILDNSSKDRRLPFISWYPFDYKPSPLYQITYLYQMVCTWVIANTHVNVDTLIASLMVYTSGECAILCDEISIKYFHEKDKHQKFLKCVKLHKCILDFAKNSNKFFSIIVMGQLAGSVLGICVVMVQLTQITPFSAEFYSVTFTQTLFFFQIFIYCWFGNEVIISSSRIAEAAFYSDWIDDSTKQKKNIIFFIRMSQKPIKLFAVKFFVLSLATFLTILRTSWSYFALLRQVTSKDN